VTLVKFVVMRLRGNSWRRAWTSSDAL